MAAHTPSEAGRFRHRVRVWSRSAGATDDFGSPSEVEIDGGLRWAAVEPLSAKELTESEAASHQTTHRVRLRWTASIDPDDELEFRGRRLRIESLIDPGEERVELVALCRETR